MKRIGSICTMTDDAVENYGEEYRDKELKVSHVARNVNEHPGYDESVSPQRLYNFEGLEFSLYDYELN